MRTLLRYSSNAAALVAIWLLLSGKTDVLHLGLGVVAALIIAAESLERRGPERFPTLRFLAFLPWLAWQVLRSNLQVARLVLSPRAKIAPRFIRKRTRVRGDRAQTLLGCAITLTPGTLAVRIDDESMLVHALDEASAKDIENAVISKRVSRVFREPAA